MRKLFALFCICGFFSVQAVYPGGQSQAGNNPLPEGNRAQVFFDDALSSMEKAFLEEEPTLEDAYYLGRALAANILTIYKPYTGNPELTRYLNHICQTIVINSPEIELFNGCHVLILDSPELNAFASPGGHIFISRGLVESLTSEDMLAAVIAHELAHIKLKHGINMISDMRLSAEMEVMANRAADLAGRDSDAARRLMNFRGSVASMSDALLKNGYSRSQEFEADQEALALLAASGYYPGALPEVLKTLEETRSSGYMGLNATHPSPRERIVNVEPWLRVSRIQDTRSYREPRFKNIMLTQ